MKFKDMLISKTRLPEEIQKLFPSSYQILGNICLIRMCEFLGKRYGKQIAGIILDNLPYVKTVCWIKGVHGEYRVPEVVILAGKETETIHRELGCKFKLDVSKIMWSKGNHHERERMISLAGKNETIVDMFAGIGYWSIPIAKHTKAKQIFAVEKNPVSFRYLQENIRLNHIPNITAILGDCRKVKLPVADRIIMGYFPDTLKFLPYALKISRKGTIIHLHELGKNSDEIKKQIEKSLKKARMKVKIKSWKVVKEFSPSKRHFVFDLCV